MKSLDLTETFEEEHILVFVARLRLTTVLGLVFRWTKNRLSEPVTRQPAAFCLLLAFGNVEVLCVCVRG